MVLSECVCPGGELRLECTIVGGFGTVWKGTAFDCPGQGNVIDLLHSKFESGTTLDCNNGMIMAHSQNRTFDGPSQLHIHFSTNRSPAIIEYYKQQTGGENSTVYS